MTPSSPATQAAGLDPARTNWLLEIIAEPEPLLLARLLQKLAVPELELLGAEYEAGLAGGVARAMLRFHAVEPRARLTAARIGKLISVRTVTLRQAD